MHHPWNHAQPDEWLPQSLRLCWGSGDSSDSGGGGTGGGDWGSAGSYDASGFDSGGSIGAWGGTAYDASMPGSPAGGGGDWGSFGATNYAGMDAPNATFADIAGPNPGVTTGGGDYGSAGAFSAAGTGGGPGGAMFGADTGAGGGFYGGGGGGGGGFWGGGDTGGGFYGGGGGGGGSMYGGGGGGGSFGSFGTGTLGGSNAVAAAPTGPSGSTFADSYGGGSVAGPAGQASSGAPTTSEAQSESAGGGETTSEGEAAPTDDAAPAQSDFGKPSESEAAPSQDEAAPTQDEAAPEVSSTIAGGRETNFDYGRQAETEAAPSHFGPESVTSQEGRQALSDLTQSALAPQQDSFDSRFGFDTSAPAPSIEATIPGSQPTDFDYGPGQQTAGPNFDQAFQAFNAPGWNPAEQMAGRAGLAEPTDWAANPYQPSTDVSVGRDFDQAFQSFDTPTGMDLAGDMPAQEGDLASQLGLQDITATPTNIDNTLTTLDDMPGVTTNLADQLGINNLTIGHGIGGHVVGVTGMNYGTLLQDDPPAPAPVNVELVPADQVPAPPPPEVQPPPPPDQPQPAPEAQPAPQTPQEATPQEAPQAPPEAPQAPPQEVEQAPPGLVDMVTAPPTQTPPAQPPGLVTMLPPPALSPPFQPPAAPPSETRPAETPAEPGEHDDAPEPQDTSQPPQDPNAPRPPENIPGQVTGARGTYTNDRMDNPRTNSNYRDSGRTDYPQGRPGITFRTARQAGVDPLFRTEDINVRDVDARLIENINGALRDMERRTGIPADSLTATSGWRPAHRGEAHEHGQDPRTSQESVFTRYNPNGRNIGPAAQPGRSNHGPGRAIDFAASPARDWLRQHAREYGLETLGSRRGVPFDAPHIQLQSGQGGQRPSAQEQAEQRALDAQNRQLAQDRGLIAPGRGNQQARPARGLDPGGEQYGVTPSPIMVGLKGKDGAFDAQAFNDHAAQLGYRGVVVNSPQEARSLIDMASGKVGLYGFSAGANAANTLLGDKGVRDKVDRVVTVAPFHSQQTQNFKGTNWDNYPDYSSRGIDPQGQGFQIQTRAHTKEAQREAATGQVPAAPPQVAQPQPPAEIPADIPANIPPQQPAPAAPTPIDRPLADIPVSLTPPVQPRANNPAVQTPIALNIIKQATAHLNTNSGEAAFQAASKVAAKEMARSGIPLAMARSLMTKSAYDGAEKVGYGPSALLFNSIYKGRIDGGIEAALQGYQPAKPGEVQGPPAPSDPVDPGKRSEAPGKQGSLLDFLQNFNPISTAEARGGRSQAGNLQAPRADPGTIQSRLSEARSDIVNELQTNQGLRNTLDLIVTGEVGSQGKAAVLGFLETAMNKVAAEASREGRAATGRDLLNYLNNRTYFPDTWGKIESGKVKGGALTDDLIGAIAAGSNTTKGSTGNSSAKSEGSRFGGNPTNATIGKEHYGVENYAHHAAWYNALGALQDMPAMGFMPPMPPPAPAELRGLAKGGHVAKDEKVVVGEEGPEFFIPDEPGTVVPHMPQARREPSKNIDRWPKIPAPDYPGRYGGVEREILRQTREAQNPVPSLIDLIDSGRLPLNAANWHAMLNDPALIALGQSRFEDRREGIEPGAEQYGVFPPAPAVAAEPPDPTSPMAQALGYGSIKRRPMQIGRQSYQP